MSFEKDIRRVTFKIEKIPFVFSVYWENGELQIVVTEYFSSAVGAHSVEHGSCWHCACMYHSGCSKGDGCLGVWQCSEGHGIKSPFSPKFFVLAR